MFTVIFALGSVFGGTVVFYGTKAFNKLTGKKRR